MRIAIVALVLSAALPAQAQQRMLFEQLPANDELPGLEVRAMLEDRSGFIWVGTSTGLARLEGTRVRAYFHDSKDPSTINNDLINDIVEAHDGSIWIATANGICTYLPDRDSFHRYYLPAPEKELHQANRIMRIVPQGEGWLWCSSEDGRLLRFERRKGSAQRILRGTVPGTDLPNDTMLARSLAWDEHHNGLWVGTRAGLCFIGSDGRSLDVRDHPAEWNCFGTDPASFPTPDGQGGLWWFEPDSFRLRYSDLKGSAVLHEDSIGGPRNRFTLRGMHADRSHRLWISTWTHELHLRQEEGRFERIPSGKKPGMVRSAKCGAYLERRNGELWLGTTEGVHILHPGADRTTAHAFEFGVNCLHSIHRDTVLVGTAGSGLHLLSRDGSRLDLAVPDSFNLTGDRSWRNNISALSPHGPDIWVSTNWGPRMFKRGERSFTDAMALVRAAPQLRSKPITFMVDDPHGTTWIGTWAEGLFRARGDSVAHWTTGMPGNTALPNNMTLSFLADSRGDAWIGFNDGGGLVRMRNCAPPMEDVLKARRGDPDRSDGVVRCLAEALDGTIWFGTHEGGAGVIDPATGQCTMLTRTDGLPGDRVLGIHFDRTGIPWIATSQGLAYRPLGADHFIAFPLPFGLDPSSLSGACLLYTSPSPRD